MNAILILPPQYRTGSTIPVCASPNSFNFSLTDVLCASQLVTLSSYVRRCLITGKDHNFKKLDPAIATTQGVGYDFASIMHYSAFAFSRNGRPTIEPVDQNTPLSALGQRQRMTTLDLQHVRELYCGEYGV
jgi:hypothetical protein